MNGNKKLALNKETLQQLQDPETRVIAGGVQEPTYVTKCIRCRTMECR